MYALQYVSYVLVHIDKKFHFNTEYTKSRTVNCMTIPSQSKENELQ